MKTRPRLSFVVLAAISGCATEAPLDGTSERESAPPSSVPTPKDEKKPREEPSSPPGPATNDLVVYATEFSIGRGHRADNKVHPYERTHAFAPYALAEGARTDGTLVVSNADGSVTIFFQT